MFVFDQQVAGDQCVKTVASGNYRAVVADAFDQSVCRAIGSLTNSFD